MNHKDRSLGRSFSCSRRRIYQARKGQRPAASPICGFCSPDRALDLKETPWTSSWVY